MIGYVRGAVSHLFSDCCFIDVNGVGYRVFIPASTRQNIAKGATVTLYTHLNVREDALLLYGFISQQEYELFLLLTSVSGIGPKVALSVLSAISPNDFLLAVSQKNYAVLTKISGIGKKTAERIVLELKDKVGEMPGDEQDVSSPSMIQAPGNAARQALEALTALGYTQQEIGPVLKRVGDAGQTVEDIVKLALKEFARR